VLQHVAGRLAAGDGGGGGEAARGAVREERWRGGASVRVCGRRRRVAGVGEAGAGCILRLGQREGDGDPVERASERVEGSHAEGPPVARIDGGGLGCAGREEPGGDVAQPVGDWGAAGDGGGGGGAARGDGRGGRSRGGAAGRGCGRRWPG